MRKYKCSLSKLVFLLALVNASSIFAQKTPVVIKKVEYAKKRDSLIEKVVRKWSGGETNFHYHYNKVDLNTDRKDDAIVFVSGSQFCGSGGCRMLILERTDSTYRLRTEMSVSSPPIWVASSKTKGWSDLLFFNSGGGVRAYYSLLRFDGKTYPKNPTIEPALPKKNEHKFVEYLSGIENYETGFEIKH